MSTLSERISISTKLPFEVRRAFANAPEPDGEERNQVMLWRECAARAIMDALGFTGHTEIDKHNAVLEEAQRWFKYSHEDVRLTFEYAQISLESCRESIIQNFPLTRKAVRITRGSTKRKSR